MALVAAAFAGAFLGLSGASSEAAAGPLIVTYISWTVVGLDSNSPTTTTLPHIYPVGARVCNTGTDSATNVSAKWTWGDTTGTNSINNAFTGPAQNTSQSIGTLTASGTSGACSDVYFTVNVNQSNGNSNFNNSQASNIIATADGGLSTTATKTVYVEKLVSQNRNQVKKWAGAGGCSTDYSVCDAAPTHVYVNQPYTFKLYAETATAYDELEAFGVWPSFITMNSASSTYSTYTSSSLKSSSSIWSDACSWTGIGTLPSNGSDHSGQCSGTGKAGGKTVVTYKVTPTTAGSATAMQPMIYDHSGSSFHYNSGFTTALESIEADWKLSTTVSGDGLVTSSPAGYDSSGNSKAINCGDANIGSGNTGTKCDTAYANNTSVTLTATPNTPTSTFSNWSGDVGSPACGIGSTTGSTRRPAPSHTRAPRASRSRPPRTRTGSSTGGTRTARRRATAPRRERAPPAR